MMTSNRVCVKAIRCGSRRLRIEAEEVAVAVGQAIATLVVEPTGGERCTRRAVDRMVGGIQYGGGFATR